jgi:hypothetical protein
MTPFYFTTKYDQTLLLGRKARNASELADGISEVPPMSIYYHTHRYLEQHHFLSPEPPNDFAYWATNVLNDDPLGEQLASIDTIQCRTIEEIRDQIQKVMDQHLTSSGRLVDCVPGEEFHFMSCRTFTLPTPYVAKSIREFCDNLEKVSIVSLYYHMFDARLRPELGRNDFTIWFRDNGFPELAEELHNLDPYTYTLEGLRKTIIKLARKYDSAE